MQIIGEPLDFEALYLFDFVGWRFSNCDSPMRFSLWDALRRFEIPALSCSRAMLPTVDGALAEQIALSRSRRTSTDSVGLSEKNAAAPKEDACPGAL